MSWLDLHEGVLEEFASAASAFHEARAAIFERLRSCEMAYRSEYNREYIKRPHVREWRRAYRKRPEVRARIRRANAERTREIDAQLRAARPAWESLLSPRGA